MFPAKKRSSFENPEPSSPKVTCIGQVRVRSKKKKQANKKLTSLSRKHSSSNIEHHTLNGFPSKRHKIKESSSLGSNERKWVHFPVTVCDALRAFGSEFTCLFPCRTERGGKRDIEEEQEQEDNDVDVDDESYWKSRRHVFEDLQIVDDRVEGDDNEARVSVCVPPKNALLLMRCRSDPMKVEALGNRSWEPSVEKTDELFDDEDQVEDDLDNNNLENLEVGKKKVLILHQDQENMQKYKVGQDQDYHNVQKYEVGQAQKLDYMQKYEVCQDQEHENLQKYEVVQDQKLDYMQKYEVGQDQKLDYMQKYEVGQDQNHHNVQKYEVGQDQKLDYVQKYEVGQDQNHDYVQKYEVGQDQKLDYMQKYEVGQDQEVANMQKYEVGQVQDHVKVQKHEESFNLESLFEEKMNQDYLIQETHKQEVKDDKESESKLPECLLMMLYEPKLSMEVSKETWVCRKDFIRRQSSRKKPPPAPAPEIKPDGGDESSGGASNADNINEVMRVADGGFPAVLRQPARSSCSFPAAPSMAMVIEQKLANAVGYEPFVLTRCKSEPMKTAAAKLLQESCVLENRKLGLERLSRVGFGVGAAGVGF
ncbi:uncharacterized protein LOC143536836 [Bidens hawaiensis]|uniref:uncharacterized protein LOC143536836 n=1 Tax=Bidens hawaiensis TaxID=980011 RepID=UPI004049E53C